MQNSSYAEALTRKKFNAENHVGQPKNYAPKNGGIGKFKHWTKIEEAESKAKCSRFFAFFQVPFLSCPGSGVLDQ